MRNRRINTRNARDVLTAICHECDGMELERMIDVMAGVLQQARARSENGARIDRWLRKEVNDEQ
jgi:hypothetical protein